MIESRGLDLSLLTEVVPVCGPFVVSVPPSVTDRDRGEGVGTEGGPLRGRQEGEDPGSS